MKIIPLFILPCTLLMNPLSANPFSLGVKVGSLGGGVESSYRINPLFSVTGSVNGFRLTAGLNDRTVDLNGKFRLLTAGGSLGIHPFKNNFKFLLGVFYNGNQFHLTSMLKRNVTIRGVTFTPDQVGTSNLTVHFNRVSPYLGMGFSSAFCNESPWSLFAELGVLFQGSPKAKLKRTGGAGTFPLVAQYIEKKAKHSADKFLLKYYPVISIGVKYSF